MLYPKRCFAGINYFSSHFQSIVTQLTFEPMSGDKVLWPFSLRFITDVKHTNSWGGSIFSTAWLLVDRLLLYGFPHQCHRWICVQVWGKICYKKRSKHMFLMSASQFIFSGLRCYFLYSIAFVLIHKICMMGQQCKGSPRILFVDMDMSKPNTCIADEKRDFWQRAGRYSAGFWLWVC